MPIVNVKGVANPINFPDDMDINNIREVLRNKFAQRAVSGQSDILSPQPNTAAPVDKTLIERAGQGVSDFLFDKGIISNRHGAQQVGKNLSALGEFLPGIGDVAAGDEFGTALAKGDKFGMAMAGLGIVPVAGDLAKKGVKYFDELPMDKVSRMARAKEQGFDVDETLYHGTLSDFGEFSAKESGFNSRSDAPNGVYFMSTSPEVASSYASGKAKKGQAKNVLDLNIKKGNGAEVRSTPTSTWAQMQLEPDLDIDVRDDFLNKNGWRWDDGQTRNYPQITDTNEMSKLLKDKGYDTAVFKGITDGKTIKANKIAQDTVAVFKAENIRSKRAKFDPKNKGSASLLGGLGALGLGIGMSGNDDKGID